MTGDRRRAGFRLALGILQIAFAVAAVIAFFRTGISRTALAITAAAASAVISSLIAFRQER